MNSIFCFAQSRKDAKGIRIGELVFLRRVAISAGNFYFPLIAQIFADFFQITLSLCAKQNVLSGK